MLFFVDLEFDECGSEKIDLISVGITTGQCSFYGELPLKSKWGSNFVEDTVAPLLGSNDANVYLSLNSLSKALHDWLKDACNSSSAKPLLICDSIKDKKLLKSKLSIDFDISVISASTLESNDYSLAYDRFFDPVLKPQHHALFDAEAIRAGYIAVHGV